MEREGIKRERKREEGRAGDNFQFFVYIFNEKDLALVPFGHFILSAVYLWCRLLLIPWEYRHTHGHTHAPKPVRI